MAVRQTGNLTEGAPLLEPEYPEEPELRKHLEDHGFPLFLPTGLGATWVDSGKVSISTRGQAAESMSISRVCVRTWE